MATNTNTENTTEWTVLNEVTGEVHGTFATRRRAFNAHKKVTGFGLSRKDRPADADEWVVTSDPELCLSLSAAERAVRREVWGGSAASREAWALVNRQTMRAAGLVTHG